MVTETCWIPALENNPAANRITAALAGLDGVLKVRADYPNRRLLLTYDTPATPEGLRFVIEALGFEVVNGLTPLYPTE